MIRIRRTSSGSAFLLVAAIALSSCGQRVSGTYSGRGTGFLDKMAFKSGGKVELTFMGMTKEGTYVVEDNKVKVTNAGETHVLTIDDHGCLDGGGLLGKYCKGEKPTDEAALMGTYRTENFGRITLNFQTGQRVRVTIAEGRRDSESRDGTYTINGDRITVIVPGGEPLMLRRKGNALEGSLDGLPIHFVKP